MGMLDNWHVRRAAEIQKKKDAAVQKDRREREEYWKFTNDMRDAVRKAIMLFIDEHAVKMEAMNNTLHVKQNDDAVLNIYRLGRDGYNKWDSGPAALTMNVKNIGRAVTCKITKVFVARDYAMDAIDKYMDYNMLEHVYELACNDSMRLRMSYVKFMSDTKKMWADNFGLYWCAGFTLSPDFEFMPKWGLNIDSFVSLDSPEGQDTLDIWREEIVIDIQMSALKTQKNTLDSRTIAIRDKYSKTKYK